MLRILTPVRQAWRNMGNASCRVTTGQPTCCFSSQTTDSPSASTTLPDWADVVVVGGGVMGCSTLYHLARNGVNNAVLLERDKLTSGTTWHTAGLVWSLRPSDTEVALIERTKDLMQQRLESETEVNTGWINNGGLFIASTKERLDEYKRMMTLGKAFNIESHILSPEETLKLYPLMNTKDISASLYVPADGTIEPAGFCNALTKAARQAGSMVFENCSVTGINVGEDDFGTKRVKSVDTDKGTIRTRTIINCAGVWAPTLGRMAGVNVPLLAMRHAYVVTEGIPGVQNRPNVRDHDASVYLKLQGDTLCVGGYEPNPIFLDQVDPNFSFGLYDLDWDVFSHNIAGCINRVPAVEEAGIKSTVCGPESFTADHKPLLGESVEVRGFYLGCGMNSSGMMLSGCGEQLAKWVINGRPEFDMFSFDIRRFPNDLTNNQKWLKERSHEAYAKNYSIMFPFDEPLASRNMQKDALHKELLDAGCVYQERHGWERPGWFTTDGTAEVLDYDFYGNYDHAKRDNYSYNQKLNMDYTFGFPSHQSTIGNECRSCREKVALFNMSYFGKFYMTGPDAQQAVDWIFSNDMSKTAGSTIYTCMLNKSAGVEADLTVSVVESGDDQPHNPTFDGRGFYVAVGGAIGQHCYSHITDIIQDEKWNCQLSDCSKDLAMLSLQGPHSRDVLRALTDTDLSNDAFPFSTNKVINVAGESVRAMRLSFVGELGWELHVPNTSAVKVYRALMEAGKQYSIANAGYRAIDNLSIEKGYRHWHGDVRADDTPYESGLLFTCKLHQDTPFLGRDALVEHKQKGLKKRLVCFTIEDDVPLLGLETIWRDGTAVGFIRRAGYAFHVNKSIAYGYVSHPEEQVVTKEFLQKGNWQLEGMGDVYPAELHMQSPFDPQHKRLKGIYPLQNYL